jgi:CheY-like chemotaxis protein
MVAQQGKTILVIDDDLDFQYMISTMLENIGFGVKNLVEGKLSAALNSAKVCDMILLDVELPGTNGVELSKQLKLTPQTEAIPIILITGHSDSEKLFSESNANALFKKPFSLSSLVSKITELLTPEYFRSPVELK